MTGKNTVIPDKERHFAVRMDPAGDMVTWQQGASDSPETEKSSQLFVKIKRLLSQIEQSTVLNLPPKLNVTIRGQVGLFKELQLYRDALQSNLYNLDIPSYQERQSNRRISSIGLQDAPDQNWNVLLCIGSAYSTCLEEIDGHSLKSTQKVNRIPELEELFKSKSAFCSTMNEAKGIFELMRQPLSPSCFLLPEQYERFVDVAEALGKSTQWILKSEPESGHSFSRVLDFSSRRDREFLRHFVTRKAIVQKLITDPLAMFGQAVSLRLFVLVTSLNPVRAYVHQQGIMHRSRYSKNNSEKITGQSQTLEEFWNFLSANFGDESTAKAKANIDIVIMQLLLSAEVILSSQISSVSQRSATGKMKFVTCATCFQLIAIDLMFTSAIEPVIVDVVAQPSMAGKEDQVSYRVKKSVLADMMDLVMSNHSVVDSMANVLERITGDKKVGIMGANCLVSHRLCLSHRDLDYIMQSRRENLHRNAFDRLYPSADMRKYRSLLGQLREKFMNAELDVVGDFSYRQTLDLHSLLEKIEAFYDKREQEAKEVVSGDRSLSVPVEDAMHTNVGSKETTILQDESRDASQSVLPKLNCSEDSETLPFISSIELRPHLQLSPSFSSHVTTFTATAPFHVVSLSILAQSSNCQSEVRLDDKYGPSSRTNYTLGVGMNKIVLIVVDVSHTEPWAVNTYSLFINRQDIAASDHNFNSDLPHQICSLKQDCDLRVYSREPCGLEHESSGLSSWRGHLKQLSKAPLCTKGSAPGRWVLPCSDCRRRDTCHWRQAIWQPLECRHRVLARETLAKCLTNKKLLFIGDSTNRGIMHYIVEKLNGSLADGDKTHDARIYRGLNLGQTDLGFAYYPKFWMPSNERPSFEKSFLELANRMKPLANNSSTVVIFGGVQWLANQHIKMLLHALASSGLEGIKLMMKGLGSGFHQRVRGVHYVPVQEQEKLSAHNLELVSYAEALGIAVVDTYNMTASRYKEFYPGKCACHFHRVIKSNMEGYFRVDGPVNAAYSEILISQICS
ncbi:Cadherin-like and PC-esterase domain-containing protein 1 [Halotydeus destructor]|nr:Cadherin-like and PC-esterase domain-containing protein 1 [Halotydeus destructor]